jgi:hypothetical protein
VKKNAAAAAEAVINDDKAKRERKHKQKQHNATHTDTDSDSEDEEVEREENRHDPGCPLSRPGAQPWHSPEDFPQRRIVFAHIMNIFRDSNPEASSIEMVIKSHT